MTVPLLQPNFEDLKKVTQNDLKDAVDAALNRSTSREKVAMLYDVFAGTYQRYVLNRRKAASKKAAKKKNK